MLRVGQAGKRGIHSYQPDIPPQLFPPDQNPTPTPPEEGKTCEYEGAAYAADSLAAVVFQRKQSLDLRNYQDYQGSGVSEHPWSASNWHNQGSIGPLYAKAKMPSTASTLNRRFTDSP